MLLQALEVDELTADEFEESAMNWLTATRHKVAPSTTVRRLASLRAFASWAGMSGSFDDYKAPVTLAGQPHPLPEGIDGVKRMLLCAHDGRHAALIALCGLMGLRVGEALGVRPSHFDMDRKMLKVRGKGDKTREVPVSDLAWEHLYRPVLAASMSDDALVIGFQDRAARNIITNLGDRAGISRRVASHDLRATFATAVYNKTHDIRLVQRLLGHSSSKQTEVYIGVSDDSMREGVQL